MKKEWGLESVSQLITQWIHRTPGAKNYAEYLFLWSSWPRLVGDNLAEHSAPYKVEKGVLHVYVDDGMTGQTLQFAFPQILEQILKFQPDLHLSRLKCCPWRGPTTIAELFQWKKDPAPPPPPHFMTLLQALDEKKQEEILTTLSQVKDIELKERLLQTWVKSLSVG